MVKIISELEKIGFEITDEQKESIKKSIGEELYSKQELDKKISKVETERDNYKKRADTAEDTLKGFEGKDFDEITKDRDEWNRQKEISMPKLPSAIKTICWKRLSRILNFLLNLQRKLLWQTLQQA